MPDAGEAIVGGYSVTRSPRSARRLMGYVPQFSALPGQMTGREVLRMYARLRGVPGRAIEDLVASLLHRLGLEAYADRCTWGSPSERITNLTILPAIEA